MLREKAEEGGDCLRERFPVPQQEPGAGMTGQVAAEPVDQDAIQWDSLPVGKRQSLSLHRKGGRGRLQGEAL